MLPALPVLPVSASGLIPVRIFRLALVPSMVRAPATLTDRLPAFPEPNVLLDTWPLVTMFRLPAVTITLPALPVLAERALLEAMPVNWVDDVPSIESVPATRT